MVLYLSRSQGSVAIKINKASYYPGETIKGLVYIKINKNEIGPGTLFIKLIGLEKANQLDEFSQYYSFKNYFYKKKRKISYFGNTLPKMAVKKYFELEVPDKYPSFQINYYKQVQCRVLYFLSVMFTDADNSTVIKPRKSHRVVVHVNQQFKQSIARPIKVSAESSQLKKCCFSMGTTKMTVFIPKTVCNIGEEIGISIIIDNGDSSIKVEKIEISVQSHLQIAYKQIKRNLNSFFGLAESTIQEIVAPHGQKVINTKFRIDAEEGKQDYVFPQSSLKTQRITYKYNLSVTAVLEKSYKSSSLNLCRVIVPLELMQQNKRIQQKPQDSDIMSQLSANLQSVSNLMPEASSARLNRSKLRQFVHSDRNVTGFGPQDGYVGPIRKYDPDESLNEEELKDLPGALEKLFIKKQNALLKEEDDEELIDKIEGVSEIPSQSSFDQKSGYDQKLGADQKTSGQTIFSQQYQQDYGQQQQRLQIINEDEEDKFKDSSHREGTKFEIINVQNIEQLNGNDSVTNKKQNMPGQVPNNLNGN